MQNHIIKGNQQMNCLTNAESQKVEFGGKVGILELKTQQLKQRQQFFVCGGEQNKEQ